MQSSTVTQILGLGSWVIAIFSCIFLFYTNSFLIKRRKKEFGLYNILGMDKHNLGIILFWETLIIAVISLVIGLAAGIAFSKLAELVFLNLLKSDATFDLTVSSQGIGLCAIIFTVINILLFFNSLRQVRFSSAISLVKSEQTGEKPPKGNWIFGILGVLLLGGAHTGCKADQTCQHHHAQRHDAEQRDHAAQIGFHFPQDIFTITFQHSSHHSISCTGTGCSLT